MSRSRDLADIIITGGLNITGDALSDSFKTDAGGDYSTIAGNDLNIVYPDTRSLFIKEGATTRLTIDNAGNVGIGTVTANNFSTAGATNVLGVEGTSGGLVSISATGTNFSGIDMGSGTIRRSGIYSLDGSHMGFYTNPTNAGGALTERMRIESNGQLRLGAHTAGAWTAAWPALVTQGGFIGSDATSNIRQGQNVFEHSDGNWKYTATAAATLYGQSAGIHSWYTADAAPGAGENINWGDAKMTLDNTGNVGIGTSSPGYSLQVTGASPIVAVQSTGVNSSRLLLSAENDAVYIGTTYGGSNIPMIFSYAGTSSGTEAMRIDIAGNLLVGTEDVNPANNAVGDVTDNGIKLGGDGEFSVARYIGTPVFINRTGIAAAASNEMINFRDDGVEVASIGTYNGAPYIGYAVGAGGGIMFNGLGIEPTGVAGARTGGTNDIGSSNYPWKDLFLSGDLITGGGGTSNTGEIQFVADSTRARIVGGYDSGGGGYLSFRTDTTGGSDIERVVIGNDGVLEAKYGVYLGGTTAANKLDDYEEGAWIPTINSGTFTATSATYTKIGNLVTVRANLNDLSDHLTATNISVGGLPFLPRTPHAGPGPTMFRYFGRTDASQMNSYVASGTSAVTFYWSFTSGVQWENVTFADGTQTNMDLIFSVSYETDL